MANKYMKRNSTSLIITDVNQKYNETPSLSQHLTDISIHTGTRKPFCTTDANVN